MTRNMGGELSVIYQAKAVQKLVNVTVPGSALSSIWMFKSPMNIRLPLSVVMLSSINTANSLHDSKILVDGI